MMIKFEMIFGKRVDRFQILRNIDLFGCMQ